jgi:hypothetical protein
MEPLKRRGLVKWIDSSGALLSERVDLVLIRSQFVPVRESCFKKNSGPESLQLAFLPCDLFRMYSCCHCEAIYREALIRDQTDGATQILDF